MPLFGYINLVVCDHGYHHKPKCHTIYKTVYETIYETIYKKAKSLYRTRAGSHFFRNKVGDFGLILGRLAMLKNWGADYKQLLRAVFHFFMGKKLYLQKKNTCVSALKSYIIFLL